MIKLRMMRWTGLVAWMGEKRNAYRLLVGKPEVIVFSGGSMIRN
jgi:hypothetical protein